VPKYSQAGRVIAIKTPLGADALLLESFRGREAISELFHFEAELLAEIKTDVRFDKIIGQLVTVEIQRGPEEKRYFNALVKSFSETGRDHEFTSFRAELVPSFWLLSKRVQSRVFQDLSVPEILQKVLKPFQVKYDLSATYHPREYCVQYRESDFAFASRLMENEGIFYFFNHTDSEHTMVVSDTAKKHPAISGSTSTIDFDNSPSGAQTSMVRVGKWKKTQELRSGSYSMRDHFFEVTDQHFEAKEKAIKDVQVGQVTHHPNVAGNEDLEIYDYPGGYATRFDGIDRGGGAATSRLRLIFEEKERLVRVRMEEQDAASLDIVGSGNCVHFSAGHKFTLQKHFSGNGPYLLTGVSHDIQTSYRSADNVEGAEYKNEFTCIPLALPYRPMRRTPVPIIAGFQTATVTGPSGEQVFCDRFGRVKAQFHWDRQGKNDGDSSCWLRVSQVWAGGRWGAFFWPRIGHEVVVAFEEGDPDRPLITGSVYNNKNMPPFVLPLRKKWSGIKSETVDGLSNQNFNAIVFVDDDDHEHLALYSERHMAINAELDTRFKQGRKKAERVPGARVFTTGRLPGSDDSKG